MFSFPGMCLMSVVNWEMKLVLTDLKNEIRAVLMSSRKPITYIELKRQYERLLFKDIPLFIFKNLPEFCRALPDVIKHASKITSGSPV